MLFTDKNKLFSIHEVCRVCGISRTTLIRMEESGFLKPCRVDGATGYRYYDAQNVASIGQYKRMQDIGLSRKEITDIYYGRKDSEEFIREQRERLSKLQRFLDEYEMRHDRSGNGKISFITLPETYCYCEHLAPSSIEENAVLCYLAYSRCIEKGYRILGDEPLMSVFDSCDILSSLPGPGTEQTYCIPVIPGPVQDENVRHFPRTKAVSILGFGTFYAFTDLCGVLADKIRDEGLKPSGPLRVIALVAPYAGTHYRREDFCYECVIPIGGDTA